MLSVRVSARPTHAVEWTENISGGGLCFITGEEIPVGDELVLEVGFPGTATQGIIEGRVVWSHPITDGGYRVGIQALTDSGRRKLADLVLLVSARPDADRAVRVLIVEDNEKLVTSYRRVLAHVDSVVGGKVQVSFAPNGHEALQQVAALPPSLVITDLYMPVMDGFVLIGKLRQEPATAHTPILVVTGGHGDESRLAAAAGADACLTKPIRFVELLESVARLLPGRG